MFSYFGSKAKIVSRYPSPIFPKIIEPFAGSARYALKYWDREIVLVDKYEAIVKIWKWLQQCSPKDIVGLPRLSQGQKLSDITSLSEEERLFLGFVVVAGNATPCNTVSMFGDWSERPNFYRNIARDLHKIQHWKIMLGDYESLPNEEATWFIDPPYQVGGNKYKHHQIDYEKLGAWCIERSGQAIVCENTQAGWLPFTPLCAMRGANAISQETMWTNCQRTYQPDLFSPCLAQRQA